MFLIQQLPWWVLVKSIGVHINTGIKAEPSVYMSSPWEGSHLFGARVCGDARSSKHNPHAASSMLGGRCSLPDAVRTRSTLQSLFERKRDEKLVGQAAFSNAAPGCPKEQSETPWKRDHKGMSSWVHTSPVPLSCSPGPLHQLLWALLLLLTLFPESEPTCKAMCADLISRDFLRERKGYKKDS